MFVCSLDSGLQNTVKLCNWSATQETTPSNHRWDASKNKGGLSKTNMARQIRVCECVFPWCDISVFLCLVLMCWCVGVFSHGFVNANVVIVLSVLIWLSWTFGVLEHRDAFSDVRFQIPGSGPWKTTYSLQQKHWFNNKCYPLIPGCYPSIPGLIVAICFVLFLLTGRKHSRMLSSKSLDSRIGQHKQHVNNTLML